MGLRNGQAALNRRQGVTHGEALTYKRDGSADIELAADDGAWFGAVRFTSLLSEAAQIEWSDDDLLLPIALITAVGEPQEGDRIVRTVNGDALTLEVMRPGTGEPAWRYSDSSRTLFRLHLKRVG